MSEAALVVAVKAAELEAAAQEEAELASDSESDSDEEVEEAGRWLGVSPMFSLGLIDWAKPALGTWTGVGSSAEGGCTLATSDARHRKGVVVLGCVKGC